MAFTYLGTLATNRDKVRFHVGDTVNAAGPRPADGNFTDAEIDALVISEGSWQGAVAACFERLASEWIRYPSFKADGLSLNRSDIARGYKEQGMQWRKDYPRPLPIYVAGIRKVDGYSDDVPSNDVDVDSYSGDAFQYIRPR